MNWIELSKQQPAIGQRVLIDTGKVVIGAKLSSYLHEKDLYWLSDLKNTFTFNEIIRWTKL